MEANLSRPPLEDQDENERERGRNITGPEKRVARYLYIVEGWKQEKIAHALQRRTHQISRLVIAYKWRKLKLRLENKLIEKALSASEKEFKEIIGLSTEVIKRFLVQTLRSDGAVNFKDAKLTSDMAANYWRLYQVVQGKPSDIKEISNMTEQETRDMMVKMFKDMQEDPMLDMAQIFPDKAKEGDPEIH